MLGNPDWGDIAAYWARPRLLYLFITATTGASGGFPFVLRLAVDLDTNRVTWRVVAATPTATTAGNANEPRGIAVNRDGWVLTGFPLVVPAIGFADSLVAFHTSFPETRSPASIFPRYILPKPGTRGGFQDLASVGMSTDAAGNFYIATGPVGSSLCGTRSSGGIVVLLRNRTLPQRPCIYAPGILVPHQTDVAVSPVEPTIYFNVNNYILRLTNPLRGVTAN